MFGVPTCPFLLCEWLVCVCVCGTDSAHHALLLQMVEAEKADFSAAQL